jgi:hypothetical protein
LTRKLTAWPARIDWIGRHQALEAQAARIDHLEQFLADLGGVAGRDLAVADDAVERRPRLGALQLLARLHQPGLGRGEVALGVVATDLGVFQLLGRGHAGGAQGGQALQLALGLVEGLDGDALGLLRRHQAVTNGGVVQPHQQVAAPHGLAVFLEHRQHDGRDFGAQVGAAVRLDGAGDQRPGGDAAGPQRDHVFRGDQQAGRGSGRGGFGGAPLATRQGGAQRHGKRQDQEFQQTHLLGRRRIGRGLRSVEAGFYRQCAGFSFSAGRNWRRRTGP